MKSLFHVSLLTILVTAPLPLVGQDELAAATTKAAPAPVTPPAEANFGNSIIRVNVTAQGYNLYQPWEKGPVGTRRGLGVIMADQKVLVTAQLVADSTYIELEIPHTGEKATAHVSVVDYEANLALIELENESEFLKGFPAVTMDNSVRVGDEVDAWQVKDTGEPSSTPCSVVEVGVSNYFLEGTRFLAYEVKGSLRYHSGSFVIPVAKGDKLVGLLLSYDSDQQISRVIATPIIEHFFKDLEDGEYEGFPTLGLAFARTIDEQLRKYLRLDRDDGGVYVSLIVPGSTAEKSGLKQGDVILQLGGHAIDARGNYDHPDYGKLNLSHIVRGDCYVDEEIPMTILRDGEKQELKAIMTRKSPKDYLIDPYRFDEGPRFFIAGGMVFQELTKPYLQIFGDQWRTRAPMRLLWALTHPDEYEKKGREKLVFLSRVIRTPATLGYENISHVIVDKVNGQPINSLKDLAKAFDWPEGSVHKIELSEAPHELFLDVRVTDIVDEQLKDAFRIADLRRLE